MRIIFMATGEIAVPTLAWLLESEHEVVAVVTQPDKPAGRSMELRAPAVKVMAVEKGVPVLQPEKIGEIREDLLGLSADLHIVMAYGQFLPRSIYEMAPLGCINLHASLLPRYRGASCIQGAIRAGDEETGITIMHVVQKLDAGNIISASAVTIGAGETGGELHDRLAELGPIALEKGLAELGPGEEQDESLMTYAPKLERAEGLVDWAMSAVEVEHLIRAFDPWPGTYTTFLDVKGKAKRLKLFPQTSVELGQGKPGEILAFDKSGLVVACGEGSLSVAHLQPEGKKRMAAGDFANSGVLVVGAVLG